MKLTLRPLPGTDLHARRGCRADVLKVYESGVHGPNGEDLVTVFAVQGTHGYGLRLTETQVRELRNALGAWLDRNAPEPAHFRAARDSRA